MLFLCNYGYLIGGQAAQNRYLELYYFNTALTDEISEMVDLPVDPTPLETIDRMRITDIVADIERKRILTYRTSRPNQVRFRKNVLASFHGRCIITSIAMPEVLEAAHIKPVEYSGNDSIANGFCMRLDMHQLFDTGHLRIGLDGRVLLSPRARREYGEVVPEQIMLPEFVSRDFLKWRLDNYNGI
jgi:predicted restriction endonuclease